jgi:hypothetical protein
MKKFIFYFLLISFCVNASCKSKKKCQFNNRFIVFAKFNLPMIMRDGSIRNVTDSEMIVYYDSTVLVQKNVLNYMGYIVKGSEATTSAIVDNYFVFDTSKQYGYYYQWYDSNAALKYLSRNDIAVKHIKNADTALFDLYKKTGAGVKELVKSKLNDMMTYNDLFRTNNCILTSSVKNGNLRTDKYVAKSIIDYTYADTIYFTSVECFPKTFYSLSKKFDSLQNRTLIAVNMIYNKRRDDKLNITINKRNLFAEIRLRVDTIPKAYLDLIDRFHKEYKE